MFVPESEWHERDEARSALEDVLSLGKQGKDSTSRKGHSDAGTNIKKISWGLFLCGLENCFPVKKLSVSFDCTLFQARSACACSRSRKKVGLNVWALEALIVIWSWHGCTVTVNAKVFMWRAENFDKRFHNVFAPHKSRVLAVQVSLFLQVGIHTPHTSRRTCFWRMRNDLARKIASLYLERETNDERSFFVKYIQYVANNVCDRDREHTPEEQALSRVRNRSRSAVSVWWSST